MKVDFILILNIFEYIVKNSYAVVEKLTILNDKINTKIIFIFDFSSLCATITHNVLNEIVLFVLNVKGKHKLDFQNHQYIEHPREFRNHFLHSKVRTMLFPS